MHWTWGFLAPKGAAGAAAVGGVISVLVADVQFSNTVTVGSIIVAALVVTSGGVFTFRNNMRTFWRNLAEERKEQIAVLEARLIESDTRYRELQEKSRAEMADVAEEQRKIRHDLKNQVAAAQQLLSAEHAKTDLTALMEQLAEQHVEAMGSVTEGLIKQDRILALLALTIPADSMPPDLQSDIGGVR